MTSGTENETPRSGRGFGDKPGTLDGKPVPAMSVSGMLELARLAMKEQYRFRSDSG